MTKKNKIEIEKSEDVVAKPAEGVAEAAAPEQVAPQSSEQAPAKEPEAPVAPAPQEAAPKSESIPKEDNKVCWQFRYKNYKEITDILDTNAPKLPSGRKQNIVVRARNYRVDLDLNIPEQRKIHEYLSEKSSQKGASFWLLEKVDRSKDTPAERGDTLRRLTEMTTHRLLSFFTGKELIEAGIDPNRPDKFQLMMAIIDKKKLT
jgi:hypothetical protein